jgi:hypothetical protein
MAQLFQFAFIVLVPVVLVAGGLVSLFLLGAVFDALEHPDELRGRIESAFRAGPIVAKGPGKDHYYQPYWEGAPRP